MSKQSLGDDDLQSFLNNFHKEIEDGNVVTITPDNVGEDKVVRKILLANRSSNDDKAANAGDDVFYLDDEGNYYIKTTPKKQSELKKATKTPVAIKTTTTAAATTTPTLQTSSGRSMRSVRGNAAATKSTGGAGQVKMASTSTRRVLQIPKKAPISEDEENEEIIDDTDVMENIETLDEDEIYEFEDAPVDGGPQNTTTDIVVSNRQFKLKPVVVEPTSTFKYACPDCSYSTNKKFLITRHLHTHEEERPFKCSLCDRGFKSNIGLGNHLNTHLGKKPHQCKQCDSAFTTSGELIRHTRYKHTKEKPHKCTECSYASVELTKLRRHMTCHTGERPFQCPHCTYASPDTFKLKRHLVTHTGEKKYQCDICKSRFTQSNSLKSHKLIHSVVDKPVFQCTLCPTTCGRKADLRLHMTNMHSSDTPIKCKRCSQELPDRYQYKLHIKTHEGEKCFSCTLCSYASVTQRHLDSHMLIHSNEKPFKCEICGMEFRQRQLLKRHTNLCHDDDYKPPQPRQKLHSCPSCSRSFTHKGNLMRHMETHDATLNTAEEKLELKRGRNIRIEADRADRTDVVIHDDESSAAEVDPLATVINLDDFVLDDLMDDDDDDDGNNDDDDGDEAATTTTEESIKKEAETNPKPIIINRRLKTLNSGRKESATTTSTTASNSNTKTFVIKEEPDAEEYTIVMQGDEQYMVIEVVDEDVQVKREPKQSNSKTIDKNNCFGFENDDEDDAYEEEFNEHSGDADGTSQEFLRLMDIIEHDN